MEHIPDDELISAYLDGELTGQDLARAEQLLASQPDSRQMLDELTALRASLQALPQQKLGADFAESVLRRAEREMLQPRAASNAPVGADVALPTPVDTWKPEVPPILSMSRWTRPLVWAALTTAAAIMIMMFSPPDAKQKVALAPQAANGPAPADLAMRAQPVDAPQNDAMIAADATSGDVTPLSAGRTPGQEQFFAGPESAAGGARISQTPEPFSVDVPSGDDPLLVVLCDVTPEVAHSANFRRLLAEHQIPWDEQARGRASGGRAAGGQRAFAAQESAGAGKEAGAPAVAKGEGAAEASKPLPAEPGVTPTSTEAVYVVAAPSQVDATIAAIAESAEYHNLQMKELTGQRSHELLAGIRVESETAPTVVTPRAEYAPAAAGVVASPLAQPATAHAAPALLSSATIAELSRAVDQEIPEAKQSASGEPAQPGDQPSENKQSDKQPSNEKQNVTNNGINRDAIVDEARGSKSDDRKYGAKDSSQQQKPQLGKGEAAPDGDGNGSLGTPQMRSGKAINGNLKASPKKFDAQDIKDSAPPKPDSAPGQDSPRTLPTTAEPQPTAAPARAAPLDASPASAPPPASRVPAPAAASSAPAPAMVPAPAPASAAAGSELTEESKGAGQVEEQSRDSRPKQEGTKPQEAVSAKRAIFLFRVVPAPVAAPQR